ncbi:MAG: hypothetical protein ACPLSJ_03545 [Thermosulfidibacteraceae bacterium]|jgi:hypothetical protein
MSHIIVVGKSEDILDILSSLGPLYSDGKGGYIIELKVDTFDILIKVVDRKRDILISLINSSYFVDGSLIEGILIDIASRIKDFVVFSKVSLPRRLLRQYGIVDS